MSHLKFSIGLSEYLPDKPKTLDEIFKISRGCPRRKEKEIIKEWIKEGKISLKGDVKG